uniref:Uncharacterized protein n=1 Tax=Rhizophora mucronata TaxID=61149 RepID=A0A2P2Q8V7_RHIMU
MQFALLSAILEFINLKREANSWTLWLAKPDLFKAPLGKFKTQAHQ